MEFSVSETGQDKSYFALDTNISKAILSNSSLWTFYDDNNKNRVHLVELKRTLILVQKQ